MSDSAAQPKHETLGDETFMSAADLRTYMTEIEQAKASEMVDSADRADRARQELVKTLSEHIELTPEKKAELIGSLTAKMKSAAERGETEVMVMRFPNLLCTDKGRAINNTEAGWPETLTGRPRQAYEFWRDHLQPANYKLKAMVVEWPNGMPGDIGFFLSWS